MTNYNAFVSPEYPLLHAVVDLPGGRPRPAGEPETVAIALGLLVGGIPSFLATIAVPREEFAPVRRSLEAGDVRVAVAGISVGEDELGEMAASSGEDEPPREPWKAPPESLPGAFLSLVCADGRKIGVARIVARAASASPEEVARFVLRQIAQGVQIPDLASTP